jgi:hypothetical protein
MYNKIVLRSGKLAKIMYDTGISSVKSVNDQIPNIFLPLGLFYSTDYKCTKWYSNNIPILETQKAMKIFFREGQKTARAVM